MNRLIKAEFYRFRHTGHLFWYALILPLVFIFIPYILCMDYMDKPLDMSIASLGTVCVLVYNFFPAFTAGVTGQLFNKGRLGYYEIMAGNSPSSIIMSKICSNGLFFSIIYTFCTSAFYIYLGVKNGVGTIEHPFIRLALYTVVITHMVFVSIMIMLTAKKAVTATICAYIRFMIFDIAVMPMLYLIANKLGLTFLGDQIERMVVFNQLEMVAMEKLNPALILHVILGFIGEFLFWYIIVYRGIKKRKIA